MNEEDNKLIIIEAPGRICLLGEHQDYLGLVTSYDKENKLLKI